LSVSYATNLYRMQICVPLSFIHPVIEVSSHILNIPELLPSFPDSFIQKVSHSIAKRLSINSQHSLESQRSGIDCTSSLTNFLEGLQRRFACCCCCQERRSNKLHPQMSTFLSADDSNELDLKDEGGIWWNNSTSSLRSIGIVWWTGIRLKCFKRTATRVPGWCWKSHQRMG
jgi:hypothetical protein